MTPREALTVMNGLLPAGSKIREGGTTYISQRRKKGKTQAALRSKKSR